MKITILLLTLFTLISCGKNESGKSEGPYVTPYSAQEEEAIKQDFIRESQEVLARYQYEIARMFGYRTVTLIQTRLRYENVGISERVLYSDRNIITRSVHQNSRVILYVGRENQELSWANYYRVRPRHYTRLVLHELLLLGEVNDRNFFYTDQILGRR